MKLLGRDGADGRKAGRFYVAVANAVILFGSKTWVMIPRMEKALEGFHHQAVQNIVGMDTKVNRMVHGCTHPLGRR